MWTRRSFIAQSGLALAAIASARADDETWSSVLAKTINTRNPITLGRILLPPSSPLWQEAHQQLDQASKARNPYSIAKYFVTSLPAKFQTAWPEPNPAHPTVANPLIVLFFLSTNTQPVGDKTPWCSAFVNWCLQNASPKFAGTNDSGSQSFVRNGGWGTEVWNKADVWPPTEARRGDVAVFTDKSDPAHGHVAFFDGATPHQPNHVDVLGGNQFNQAGLHTFSLKSLGIHNNLELVSIRTEKGLRDV
ncbi:CHAP domain-containing protein [Mesorhizobium dulcispinae]|uniref:CHAP domain-containing protein n=1 Tax=Mesorhizobium dulcispinae TaxID=3072316 RepID=UPI002A247DDA|nr:CHAP domain-containing protein [Mesorhizobium sp. VK23D]MDX8520469.1 CHAP domain-containing protein [Mesorhizobium sp. VK23D]